MAKTGPTFSRIKPMSVAAGMPRVERLPEGSSNTFIIGAPIVESGGYLDQMATNGSELLGFALKDGGNTAADGGTKSQLALARGQEFVGSFDGVLNATDLGAAYPLLYSASTWYIGTNTDLTNTVTIRRPALGYAVGDTDPLVIFTVLDAAIQEAD